MRKEGLAGAPDLSLVLFGRELVGPVKQVEIVTRAIAVHLIRQLGEAQIHRAPGGKANRRFP
jgi:hypothetical protein